MKHDHVVLTVKVRRRVPHGARGLKLIITNLHAINTKSRPTRGAWIETAKSDAGVLNGASRPTRGAWIETLLAPPTLLMSNVASHTGRVD